MSIVLDYCPECSGVGTIDGRECGVCCGDRLIWPDDGSKPGWLDGRFQDHSSYAHRCDRCQRPPGVLPGAERIAIERDRQVTVEGYTPAHDDNHSPGEFARAARAYALAAWFHVDPLCGWTDDMLEDFVLEDGTVEWPWEAPAWKPSDDPVRNLEKAGALIAAEIDRLQRQAVPA